MAATQTSYEGEFVYFEKERERLVAEITSTFEDLLSSSNLLNRKLEEVLGVGREFETISSLWGKFHDFMREQDTVDVALEENSIRSST
ncbi:hypothetical protein DACRYDRAFT_49957 [Dacryopinax primogenitus]|uniref:DASH complex subunit DAD1 n=1 Tax=Dacryopinax primogenitus (strain DJM 731) TaxID=1858805 RepID=M5G3G6_DACPD|nr:uncharacterized protein DACRYDRAFT_49957 [Dacryopinax primogenitus]EJU03214.1 hypothetical protein DACRYDRAFT_49957 [Dacryopinax primogenitus]